MGNNISNSLVILTNKFAQDLVQKAGASSVAVCNTRVGNIKLINPKNARVINVNLCGPTDTDAVETIISRATNLWINANDKMKTKLLPGIDLDAKEISVKHEIRNKLEQDCRIDANMKLKIATDDITIEGCEDVEIKNINTGSIEGNCAIRKIINVIIKYHREEDMKMGEEPKEIPRNFSIIIIIIISIIIFCVVGIIILLWYFRKNNFI